MIGGAWRRSADDGGGGGGESWCWRTPGCAWVGGGGGEEEDEEEVSQPLAAVSCRSERGGPRGVKRCSGAPGPTNSGESSHARGICRGAAGMNRRRRPRLCQIFKVLKGVYMVNEILSINQLL